jgi:hypothetical protein
LRHIHESNVAAPIQWPPERARPTATGGARFLSLSDLDRSRETTRVSWRVRERPTLPTRLAAKPAWCRLIDERRVADSSLGFVSATPTSTLRASFHFGPEEGSSARPERTGEERPEGRSEASDVDSALMRDEQPGELGTLGAPVGEMRVDEPHANLTRPRFEVDCSAAVMSVDSRVHGSSASYLQSTERGCVQRSSVCTAHCNAWAQRALCEPSRIAE